MTLSHRSWNGLSEFPKKQVWNFSAPSGVRTSNRPFHSLRLYDHGYPNGVTSALVKNPVLYLVLIFWKISKVTAGKRTRVFRMLSDDADHYTMEAAILQKLLFCLYKQQNGLLTFVSTPCGLGGTASPLEPPSWTPGGQKRHFSPKFEPVSTKYFTKTVYRTANKRHEWLSKLTRVF